MNLGHVVIDQYNIAVITVIILMLSRLKIFLIKNKDIAQSCIDVEINNALYTSIPYLRVL